MAHRIVVLCLHGARQDADLFRRYCAPLIRYSPARVEFHFLDALYCDSGLDCGGEMKPMEPMEPMEPDSADHAARAADMNDEGDSRRRKRWWWPRELELDEIGRVEWTAEFALECEPALESISRAIEETGASVLLGFSQGANAAVTYMEARQDSRIDRVVSCCGYNFLGVPSVDVPILNVISDDDRVVPIRFTPLNFKSVRILKHDKGHRMVTRANDARLVVDFITRQF